jgi:leader peptidase (prepilin peptidase)/N-methyltransferase
VYLDKVKGLGKTMVKVCVLLFLWINARSDVKKREISLSQAGILAVCGISGALWQHVNILERIVPMGIGLFLIGFSLLTHGGFGMGDALILCALACVLNMEMYLSMLLFGLLLASFWSVILTVFMKKSRKSTFPFVPFLLFGYVGGLWLCEI